MNAPDNELVLLPKLNNSNYVMWNTGIKVEAGRIVFDNSLLNDNTSTFWFQELLIGGGDYTAEVKILNIAGTEDVVVGDTRGIIIGKNGSLYISNTKNGFETNDSFVLTENSCIEILNEEEFSFSEDGSIAMTERSLAKIRCSTIYGELYTIYDESRLWIYSDGAPKGEFNIGAGSAEILFLRNHKSMNLLASDADNFKIKFTKRNKVNNWRFIIDFTFNPDNTSGNNSFGATFLLANGFIRIDDVVQTNSDNLNFE
jgi:hypothetical protein